MPTQAIIPVTPGSGLDLDAVSLVIGVNTVFREVLVIADSTSPTELAAVSGGALAVFLPTAQITTLTPPTAAAVGTAVSADLLIGTQLAAASVPVALPTATITALTPPTAAAIAAAIVANPPTTFNGVVTNAGTFAVQATLAAETTKVIGTVNQGTSPWVVSTTFSAPQHIIVDSGTLTAVTSITNPVAVGVAKGTDKNLVTDPRNKFRFISYHERCRSVGNLL